MHALLGIIHQTMLNAIRSRLFVSELMLVLAVSIAGPMLLESDGSLHGHVSLTVRYILTANWVLLGMGILWAAGSDVAADMASKRLHLVTTKPIGGIRLLLGRWLGLLGLHSLLVLLGVGIAAAMVAHTSQNYPKTAAARTALLAHAIARPTPNVTPDTVRSEFDKLRAAGKIQPQQTFEDVAPLIRSSLLAKNATVSPGQTQQWTIPAKTLQAALTHARGPNAWLRFRFTSSAFERIPINATWTLATPNAAPIHATVADIQDGEHVLQLPISQIQAHAEGLTPDTPLTVAFHNGDASTSCTIMFDTLEPIELLLPRSTLGQNMLRAALVMICSLGALAALGLLCGSLFSGPVAAVAGLGALAAAFLAISTADTVWADSFEATQTTRKQIAHLTDVASTALRRAAEPALRHQTITRLTSGEWLSVMTLATACLPLLLIYSAPLIILGGAVLNRKQLGGT